VQRLDLVTGAIRIGVQHDAPVFRVRREDGRRFALELQAEARESQRLRHLAAHTRRVVKQTRDRIARMEHARGAQSAYVAALLDDGDLAPGLRQPQRRDQAVVSRADDDCATHIALDSSSVAAHS
jgi:hypothetical protein